MAVADIQPKKFMPTEAVLIYGWEHQRKLLTMGYNDAKRNHDLLVSRGLIPLPSAPLTPWSEWQALFDGIDETRLPPFSKLRATHAISESEKRHAELLKTYSATDLQDMLMGPRMRLQTANQLRAASHQIPR